MEAGCKRSLTSICTAWPLRLFQLRVEIQWWVYWVWAGRPTSRGSIPDSKTMILLLLCKVPPQVIWILKLGIGVVALGLRRQKVTTHRRLLLLGIMSQISHNFITCTVTSFANGDFISAPAPWEHFGVTAAKSPSLFQYLSSPHIFVVQTASECLMRQWRILPKQWYRHLRNFFFFNILLTVHLNIFV